VLLVVFFFTDDDVTVDEDIVEQEKLPSLGFLAAHFRQDSFSDQDPPGDSQRLRQPFILK